MGLDQNYNAEEEMGVLEYVHPILPVDCGRLSTASWSLFVRPSVSVA